MRAFDWLNKFFEEEQEEQNDMEESLPRPQALLRGRARCALGYGIVSARFARRRGIDANEKSNPECFRTIIPHAPCSPAIPPFSEKRLGTRLEESDMEKIKSKLSRIASVRTRSAIVRSRTRWYEHGERNSKYFHNLEKTN